MRTHRMYAARPLFVKGKKKVLHCHVHFIPKNMIAYVSLSPLYVTPDLKRQGLAGSKMLAIFLCQVSNLKVSKLALLSQTLQFPSARRSILVSFSSSHRFPGHCFGSVSGLYSFVSSSSCFQGKMSEVTVCYLLCMKHSLVNNCSIYQLKMQIFFSGGDQKQS